MEPQLEGISHCGAEHISAGCMCALCKTITRSAIKTSNELWRRSKPAVLETSWLLVHCSNPARAACAGTNSTFGAYRTGHVRKILNEPVPNQRKAADKRQQTHAASARVRHRFSADLPLFWQNDQKRFPLNLRVN